MSQSGGAEMMGRRCVPFPIKQASRSLTRFTKEVRHRKVLRWPKDIGRNEAFIVSSRGDYGVYFSTCSGIIRLKIILFYEFWLLYTCLFCIRKTCVIGTMTELLSQSHDRGKLNKINDQGIHQ